MALYITFVQDYACQIEWHVGDSKPSFTVAEIAKVECVQADGDELAYLDSSKFVNLPMVLGIRVMRWFGNHAKFIVANL